MALPMNYRRPLAGTQPEYLSPAYLSSRTRAPGQPAVSWTAGETESSAPRLDAGEVDPAAADLTRQHAGEPLGARIIVTGRVLDENACPVAGTLVELWQANAAGRYRHDGDQHDAPLDPNFSGAGQVLTGPDGRYRFVTIRPGEYPWGNHHNAWRPAHLHFSVFGPAMIQRLVTQMYFPGDPLLEWDPIFQSIPDVKARARLVAQFDWEHTLPGQALGYRFDIILRGPEATPAQGSQQRKA